MTVLEDLARDAAEKSRVLEQAVQNRKAAADAFDQYQEEENRANSENRVAQQRLLEFVRRNL